MHVQIEKIGLEKKTPGYNQIKFSLIEFRCTCMALIYDRVTLLGKAVSYSDLALSSPSTNNIREKQNKFVGDR